jgi:putative ABC transport system permease protein
MLHSILQDVRFALRSFLRRPGTSIVALGAIALGIGGTAAVFSVVDRILFRPLPYVAQDRLVWLGMKAPISPDEFLLEADYGYLREHATVFEAISAMSRTNDCDLNEEQPARLACTRVASDLLPLLGVEPLIGRQFTAEEDRPNGPKAAMLSYGFWRSRYGGDRGVLGKTIRIDGAETRIVGVLPPGFEQPNLARADVLLPWQLNIAPGVQRSFLMVFARLKPGITPAQARSALEPLFEQMRRNIPAGFAKEVTFHLTPLRERQIRDHRQASVALLWAVGALLLIACANVANLLLARVTARAREFASRRALGASPWRLVRQTLTESTLLCVIGGACGIALAYTLVRGVAALAPEGILRLRDASVDGRVLAFAVLLSVISGLVAGAAPALRVRGVEELTTRAATSGHGLTHALLAVQIGFSVVLLTGAALLINSLWNLQSVRLGMRTDRVIAVRVYATQPNVPELAFERLRGLPGVSDAALSDTVPLYGGTATMIYSAIRVEGRPVDPKRQTGGMTVHRTVTPGYFRVLGIPVREGRNFTDSDTDEAIILDERLARRMFPGESAVGKRIQPSLEGPWRTVVGVAAAVKNAGPAQSDDPEYYYAWPRGKGRTGGHILLRSEAEPAALASLIRDEFRRVDPTVPITITTMQENIQRHTARPRFLTTVLAMFAGFGVLLAAAGQFALIAYAVTQRTAEIGIRMALGALAPDVVRLVTSRALAWSAGGALAGLAGAWWAGRFLQPLLFGVRADDKGTAVIVLLFLFGVSAAAALPPVLRAVRVDPATALRHE